MPTGHGASALGIGGCAIAIWGNGENNVHIIAVSWPHRVFVSKNFTAVGAE